MLNVGIDLGGTNIKAGLVTDDGTILAKRIFPTRVSEGFEAILGDMIMLVNGVIHDARYTKQQVVGIGIGIPGIQNHRNNRIAFCNNLNWCDVPLLDRLQERTSMPCFAENDAAVAALAEANFGASRNTHDSILITLGTGVGGGMIMDGRIHTGSHGVGVEMGHMVLVANGKKCTCGKRGCWESYASATALIRQGRMILRKRQSAALEKLVQGKIENLTAQSIIDLAKKGDEACLKAFKRYVYHLSAGIASLINAFDPERIVLGGGISHAGDFLLSAVREEVKQLVFCNELPFADIVLAKLGNDAGIIGASLLCCRN